MSSLLAYYLYLLVQNLLGNQEDVHSDSRAAAKTLVLVATNILLVHFEGEGEATVRKVNLLTTCVGVAREYPPLHLAAIIWTVPVIGHPGAECPNHSALFQNIRLQTLRRSMRFKSEGHQPQLFLMRVKCQHHRHFMRGAAGHVPRSVRHETRGCEEISAWSLGELRCW